MFGNGALLFVWICGDWFKIIYEHCM